MLRADDEQPIGPRMTKTTQNQTIELAEMNMADDAQDSPVATAQPHALSSPRDPFVLLANAGLQMRNRCEREPRSSTERAFRGAVSRLHDVQITRESPNCRVGGPGHPA